MQEGIIENIRIISSPSSFYLAIPKDGQYIIFQYQNVKQKTQPRRLMLVPGEGFTFIPGDQSIISCFQRSNFYYNCEKQQAAYSKISLIERPLFTFVCERDFLMIASCNFSSDSWNLKYIRIQTIPSTPRVPPRDRHPTQIFQLCSSKKYPKPPYSFSIAEKTFTTGGYLFIACISEKSLYLHLISNYQEEKDYGACAVNCDMGINGIHKEKFGCGFLHGFQTSESFFLASWCLECQDLQVFKIETCPLTGFPGTTRHKSAKLEVDLRFEFLTGIESIQTFKKGIIVVTKDWNIYTCDDITDAELCFVHSKKKLFQFDILFSR